MNEILKEFDALKAEYLTELSLVKPSIGLKDVDKFKYKVNYALDKVESIIETEPEPLFKVEYGNKKLPKTTIISSCGSWFNCPCKKDKQCEICDFCYDKYVEIMFKDVLASRILKEVTFRTYNSDLLAEMIIGQCKKTTTLNRFNEVGDIRNLQDYQKLVDISNILFDAKNVTSYVYTHNKNIDYHSVEHPNLRVNGSNFMVDNCYFVTENLEPENLPPNSKRCICDCEKCDTLCIKKGLNIYEVLRKP